MIYPPVGVLKLLRDAGRPMAVEVAPEDRSGLYRVTRDEDASETIKGSQDTQEMADRMKDILSLYPRAVTVNGEQVQRLSFEGIAKVTVSRHQHHLPGAEMVEETVYTPFLKKQHERYDVLAGGVLAATGAGHGGGIQYHHSPGRQEHPHWRFADTVLVAPLTVIGAPELAQMTDESMLKLTDELRSTGLNRRLGVGKHHEPYGLVQRVIERDRSQVKRALGLPQMPEIHQGEIFWYAGGKSDLTRLAAPAIIVYGTPVIIPKELGSNCQIASVAEAMYRHGQGEVPVILGWASIQNQDQDRLPKLREFNFKTGTKEGQGNVRWADRITLTYFLQGEELGREMPADFTASGKPHDPQIVLSREGEIPAHLAERLGYAYSDDVVCRDTAEWSEISEQVEREIILQVKMETEGALEAHREELGMIADQMAFQTPNPDAEISATSKGGTVTITSRPG